MLEERIKALGEQIPNAVRKQKRLMRYEHGWYKDVLDLYRSYLDTRTDTDYVDGQPHTIQIGDYLK